MRASNASTSSQGGWIYVLALLALGGTVVGLALHNFTLDDERWSHNAWTYIAAVPAGILLITAFSQGLLNNWLERTLQGAFLLSLAIHMLFIAEAPRFLKIGISLPTTTKSDSQSDIKKKELSETKEFSQVTYQPKSESKEPTTTSIATAMTRSTLLGTSATDTSLQNDQANDFPTQELELQSRELPLDDQTLQAIEIERQAAEAQQAEITSKATDIDRQISEAPDTKDLSTPNAIDVPDQIPNEEASPQDIAGPRQSMLSEPSRMAADTSDLRLPQRELELDVVQPTQTSIQRQNPELQPSEITSNATNIDRQAPGSFRTNNLLAPSSIGVPDQLPAEVATVPGVAGPRQFESMEPSRMAAGSLPTQAAQPTGPSGFEANIRPRDTAIGVPNPTNQADGARQRETTGSLDAQLSLRSRGMRVMPRSDSPGSTLSPSDMVMSGTVQGLPPLPAEGGGGGGGGSQLPNTDVASLGVDRSMRIEGGPARGAADVSLGPPSASLPSAPSGSSGGLPGPHGTDLQPRNLSGGSRSLASMGLPSAADRMPSQIGQNRSLPINRADSGLSGPPSGAVPAPAFARRAERNNNAPGSNDDLGEFGPQTELAIEAGLKFLAQYQRPDGSWSLADFGDRPLFASDTAATALSLLSFQGAGYSHLQYQYQDNCRRAIEFLLAHQTPEGDLYIPMNPQSDQNARFYSHGIAALALCEAYGMTQDERLREPAQRSINFLVATQDPRFGGWRYTPRTESDTSVTGWCMMAMKSAELAGLQVNRNSYQSIETYLNNAQASELVAYQYRYNFNAADTAQTKHGLIPSQTMTGIGLLLRLYLGWRRDNVNMIRGADYLLESMPQVGTVKDPKRDTYYWYYATQVMFHMGGDHWKKWNTALHPILIQSQLQRGRFAGSWDAGGSIPDRWGLFAGRLYVTTLNLLSLEVYYRHLPIYEETAK